MNSEFRAAKNTIRAAVAAAPRPTVESILEAAREGRVPWYGTMGVSWGEKNDVACWGCLSQRLLGSPAVEFRESDAYYRLARKHSRRAERHGDRDEGNDPLRHQILMPILRADLRRRDREAVKALVESAYESCEVTA